MVRTIYWQDSCEVALSLIVYIPGFYDVPIINPT